MNENFRSIAEQVVAGKKGDLVRRGQTGYAC